MGDTYQPINTGRKLVSSTDINIELEKAKVKEPDLKEIELEEEEEDSPEGDIELDLDTGEIDGKELKDTEKQKPGRPKGTKNKSSKRDKRIKQLLDKASQAEQEKAILESELEELRKAQFESKRVSNESRKTDLENTIKALQGQLKIAIEDDDSDKIIALNQDIMNAQLTAAQIGYEIENSPKEYTPQRKQSTQQVVPSEYALDWVEEHPEFKTDQEFYHSALGVNAKLISEGYDTESEDFYSELDKRLSRRYPEYYEDSEFSDTDLKNVVQSKSKSSKVVETENLDDDPDDIPQTVAGASRTPTGSTSSKSGRKRKNTVILTEEDQTICNQWGIDPVQYARRKQQIESTSKGDYVPINIKK